MWARGRWEALPAACGNRCACLPRRGPSAAHVSWLGTTHACCCGMPSLPLAFPPIIDDSSQTTPSWRCAKPTAWRAMPQAAASQPRHAILLHPRPPLYSRQYQPGPTAGSAASPPPSPYGTSQSVPPTLPTPQLQAVAREYAWWANCSQPFDIGSTTLTAFGLDYFDKTSDYAAAVQVGSSGRAAAWLGVQGFPLRDRLGGPGLAGQ